MSKYYTLYKAIKDLCPTNLQGSFSVLKENSERSYGIFLKGGTPSEREMKGRYLQSSQLVTFNVNGSKSVEGIKEAMQFCDDVKSTLEVTYNHEYTDPETGEQVTIIGVDVELEPNMRGYNRFDIPVYSMDFIIKYSGGV